MTPDEEIDILLGERRTVWAAGDGAVLKRADIESRLTAAYDRKRREEAEALHGAHDEIRRRARIGRELEKLALD